MISQKQLTQLKMLFREDDVEISDEAAVEVGHWLLERARSVCRPIPPDKLSTYRNIVEDMRAIHGLHKEGTVRDNHGTPCRETSNS